MDAPYPFTNQVYNLEREGFKTRSALTGAAGLAQSFTDLVLLELMLPDMSDTDSVPPAAGR